MAMFWKDTGWRCRSQRPIQGADLMGLTHLYQPIIGTTAIALYLTLMNQLPAVRAGVSETYGHSYLLKLCALSFDQLLEARYLLEGVGLLNTYEKKDAEQVRYYEYELIPPLTPAKFFQSDVLSLTLFNLLGKERYLAVRNQLIDSQLTERPLVGIRSTNITRSFQEVFGSFSPQDVEKIKGLERESGRLAVDESHINGQYPVWIDDDLVEMLRARLSNMVSADVWTEALLTELQEIRFLYQLDEWDLLKALQNPYVTRNGKIDLERLRSFVKSEYRLRFGAPPQVRKRITSHGESSSHAPTVSSTQSSTPHPLMPSSQPSVVPAQPPQSSTSSPTEEEHFRQLAHISPLELLSHYQGGTKIPDSDVELVESLLHHYGLPPGVVNVLLEYVLLKYDYKLPKQLVEKIAGHWKRLKVKTVEEASQQAKKETWEVNKKKEVKKTYASRTTAPPPSLDQLPRAVAKQMEQQQTSASLAPFVDSEEKESFQAKLKLMHERLNAKKTEGEGTP